MKVLPCVLTCPVVLLCVCLGGSARAATLTVGNGATYATIASAMANVQPGDVVEVRGDQSYQGTITFRPEYGGEPNRPVTVRGVPVNGHLPILQGVGTGQWDSMVVLLNASHFVFEGFEVVGAADQEGIVHKADDVVVRNVVVHGAGSQGLMGTDSDSGSLTLEYSELYGNGNGMYSHQIYMATDETAYPGSVFRMQFCWVHDGTGGNNVKSRAERNEIYYNWIEGAVYHELDLIGPDGQDPDLAREDSDVVGNVLIKTSEWRIARIGGDGTGNTAGRYRFVNNTMILSPTSSAAIGLQETVESLEMFNNVLYGPTGGTYLVYNQAEPSGPNPSFFGGNNWVVSGMQSIPSTWTNTVTGADPGWTNRSGYDLRPASGSPLLNAGSATTSTTGTLAFPSPLHLPAYVPPARTHLAPTAAEARDVSGVIDIGAFESTSNPAPDGGAGGDARGNTGGGLAIETDADNSSGGAANAQGGSSIGGSHRASGGSSGTMTTRPAGDAQDADGGSSGTTATQVPGARNTGGTPSTAAVGLDAGSIDGSVLPASEDHSGGCGCRLLSTSSERTQNGAAFVFAWLMLILERTRRRSGNT